MSRYDDQPEYNRNRDAIRRNDGRDVRRAVDPSDRRTTLDRGANYHMDDAMDVRMDVRPEPRAAPNTGTRLERPVRGNDSYQDRPAPYQRDVPSRRTPYEHEFDDMPSSKRPIIVAAHDSGQAKQTYNEYFLPGDGIERIVIQAEICRYLGQDATCRPGNNPQDGRSGYIIKAYRALTTAMIRSLQESSAKLRNDDRNRNRRPDDTYTPIQDHQQYSGDVDMDDDDHHRTPYEQPDRYNRDIDRVPRTQMNTRHPPPVTSAYIQESGFPAYSIPSTHIGPHPMGYEPRSYAPGNTTPPTTYRPAPYAAPDYPPRTSQPSASAAVSAQPYQDPRTGKIVSPSYAYPPDTRHRR